MLLLGYTYSCKAIIFFFQYVVQKPFPILVGPCIFAGSLYPLGEEDSINVRMEYSINGPQENYVSFTCSLNVYLQLADLVVSVRNNWVFCFISFIAWLALCYSLSDLPLLWMRLVLESAFRLCIRQTYCKSKDKVPLKRDNVRMNHLNQYFAFLVWISCRKIQTIFMAVELHMYIYRWN